MFTALVIHPAKGAETVNNIEINITFNYKCLV